MANRALDAGAALGAAALVVSGYSLFAQHAPDLADVHDSSPGSGVAGDLRRAELAAAAVVVVAGGVASVLMRERWPLLLSLTTVGAAIGVYEVSLRTDARRGV